MGDRRGAGARKKRNRGVCTRANGLRARLGKKPKEDTAKMNEFFILKGSNVELEATTSQFTATVLVGGTGKRYVVDQNGKFEVK